MGVRWRPIGFRNYGITLAAIGTVVMLSASFMPLSATSTVYIGGAVIGVVGLSLTYLFYFTYDVDRGDALIHINGRVDYGGMHCGFVPKSSGSISTSKIFLEIPGNNTLLPLETPDGGCLGVSVRISYAGDFDHNPVVFMQNYNNIATAIDTRVRGALNRWVKGKPIPGTLKKALSMQSEVESYLHSKLVTSTSDELRFLATRSGDDFQPDRRYPIEDLGVILHEIHIQTWMPLTAGTDKPDWGDGDHVSIDAQSVFKKLHSHTDNLSSLRRLKDALKEKYPEETDDIEDIYDQERISMKENRDR